MNKKIGVYMIMNTLNNKCYIGSSRNIFHRWSEHKSDSKRRSNQMYQDMKEFGFVQFQFIILEECTIDELKELEQYYIDRLHPEYNRYKANAGISVSFSEDAKSYQSEYGRKWRESNKESIKERRRKYYQTYKK